MAPLSPGFWTAEPQLTRQRGPGLSSDASDRHVLLSAVNDNRRERWGPEHPAPRVEGSVALTDLDPTWFENRSPLFSRLCRVIETLSCTIFALVNRFCAYGGRTAGECSASRIICTLTSRVLHFLD